MGCQACQSMPLAGVSYPYRWKHATIEIIACAEHAKEVIDALNKAQQAPQEERPSHGM